MGLQETSVGVDIATLGSNSAPNKLNLNRGLGIRVEKGFFLWQ